MSLPSITAVTVLELCLARHIGRIPTPSLQVGQRRLPHQNLLPDGYQPYQCCFDCGRLEQNSDHWQGRQ